MSSPSKPTRARKRTAGQISKGQPAGDRAGNRTGPSSAERHRLIAEAAFFRAEKRGFAGGDPLEDWLEAEREIDQQWGLRD